MKCFKGFLLVSFFSMVIQHQSSFAGNRSSSCKESSIVECEAKNLRLESKNPRPACRFGSPWQQDPYSVTLLCDDCMLFRQSNETKIERDQCKGQLRHVIKRLQQDPDQIVHIDTKRGCHDDMLQPEPKLPIYEVSTYPQPQRNFAGNRSSCKKSRIVECEAKNLRLDDGSAYFDLIINDVSKTRYYDFVKLLCDDCEYFQHLSEGVIDRDRCKSHLKFVIKRLQKDPDQTVYIDTKRGCHDPMLFKTEPKLPNYEEATTYPQ